MSETPQREDRPWPEALGGEAPCSLDRIDDQRDAQAGSRPDLATPTQVHDLVTLFYREVVFDEVLEPMFGEVAEVDWADHIPRLIDYWCWILLGTERYSGAVTRTHRNLHDLHPVTPEHCDRWFGLWQSCIDANWAGPRADHAKSHAEALMAGMAKHVFGYEWKPKAAVAGAP